MAETGPDQQSINELVKTAKALGELVKAMKQRGEDVSGLERLLVTVDTLIFSADYNNAKANLLQVARELKRLDGERRRAVAEK